MSENTHMFFVTLITVITAIFSKARISQHSLGWRESGGLKITTKRPFIVRGQTLSVIQNAEFWKSSAF